MTKPTLGRIVHVKPGGQGEWQAGLVIRGLDKFWFRVVMFVDEERLFNDQHTFEMKVKTHEILLSDEGVSWRWPPREEG